LILGDNLDEFTVQVHHGGSFVGFGHLRSYVDGKTLWLDDMLMELQYPKTPNLKYYWLLPGKELADGLRVIHGDADTNAMCSVVGRIKNLVVYFNHGDTDNSAPWDDIVSNPITQLPKVVSPVKVQYREKKEEKIPNFYKNLSPSKEQSNNSVAESGSDNEGSEDSDFWDSENELDDGDDDLFVDHVDEDVVVEGIGNTKKIGNVKKAKGCRLKVDRAAMIEELSTDDEEELCDNPTRDNSVLSPKPLLLVIKR
jgi:hypothetical protein